MFGFNKHFWSTTTATTTANTTLPGLKIDSANCKEALGQELNKLRGRPGNPMGPQTGNRKKVNKLQGGPGTLLAPET